MLHISASNLACEAASFLLLYSEKAVWSLVFSTLMGMQIALKFIALDRIRSIPESENPFKLIVVVVSILAVEFVEFVELVNFEISLGAWSTQASMMSTNPRILVKKELHSATIELHIFGVMMALLSLKYFLFDPAQIEQRAEALALAMKAEHFFSSAGILMTS